MVVRPFGEDFYVELQRHGIADQDKVNEVLLKFGSQIHKVPSLPVMIRIMWSRKILMHTIFFVHQHRRKAVHTRHRGDLPMMIFN